MKVVNELMKKAQIPNPSHLSIALPPAGDRGLSKKKTFNRPLPSDPFTLYVRPSDSGDLPELLKNLNLDYKEIEIKGKEGIPKWLEEYYDGETPCLRHGSEAYVGKSAEQYLEFFFKD